MENNKETLEHWFYNLPGMSEYKIDVDAIKKSLCDDNYMWRDIILPGQHILGIHTDIDLKLKKLKEMCEKMLDVCSTYFDMYGYGLGLENRIQNIQKWETRIEDYYKTFNKVLSEYQDECNHSQYTTFSCSSYNTENEKCSQTKYKMCAMCGKVLSEITIKH